MTGAIRDWFFRNWMYAGAVAAAFLFAIVPILASFMSLALLLIYAQLPVYMLHQVEEHAGDRFRTYFNALLAGGKDALTSDAVVFINVVGVWGGNLLVFYLARFAELGYGLIAVYLTLVNALAHFANAAATRRYNPGLATAACLFVPIGAWALYEVSRSGGVTARHHFVGLAVALLAHAAIVIHVRLRIRAMAAG
jgi:hypothetical protein